MRRSRRQILGQVLAAGGTLLLAGGLGRGHAAAAPAFRFDNIDGGRFDLADWRGRPVLVVNTASLCGYARQFDALQQLQDDYADRGLIVLAVPSDDFRQELASAAEVKEYCAVNFDLTLRMTGITHVKGAQAHPFYRWMAEDHGFTPGWNFNKILLGRDGLPVGTWGAPVAPLSAPITGAIDAALG